MMNLSMRLFSGIWLSTVVPFGQYTSAPLQPSLTSFAHLASLLKSEATFPVLLPSQTMLAKLASFATIEENVTYKYMVVIGKQSHCHAAGCTVARVIGHEENDPTSPPMSGSHVRLKNNTVAFWSPRECAYVGGCSFAGLTYEQHGHVYNIFVRNGSLNEVVSLANSMRIVR